MLFTRQTFLVLAWGALIVLSVFAGLLISYTPYAANASEIHVTPGQRLQDALDAAKPGDTIVLADGVYQEDLVTKHGGTKSAPITIHGSKNAILKGAGGARIFEINHDYIHLEGFTIDGLVGSGGKASDYRDKLLYIQGKGNKRGVEGAVISHMTFKNAGGECVRFRYFAKNNEFANNIVGPCGAADFKFGDGGKNGEGVYIGTAPEQTGDGKNPTHDRDVSSNNWIHDNTFNTEGNECVDIKEGATGNVVERNSCTGQKDPESGGFDSRGSGNIFRNNRVFDTVGAGFRLGGDESSDGVNNSVYNNTVTNAKGGGIKVQREPQKLVCGNRGATGVGDYGKSYTPASNCPSGTDGGGGDMPPPPPPGPTPPPPPPAGGPGKTLISETFTSPLTTIRGGVWVVGNGRFVLMNPATGAERGNGNIAVHPQALNGNFTISVDAMTISTEKPWNDFSIIFGFVDEKNYYYASFNESNDENTSGIFRVTDGKTPVQIADITSLISPDKLYAIRVVRQGSRIEVYKNKVLVGSATESAAIRGKIGFGTRNDSARFDNLTVTTP